jgi:DNA invertase Pin-like site-specific DNA recombinase
MSKHGHRVGYIRVSTVDQNSERQLDGIGVDKTFIDRASGKDANRPALQEALRYCRERDTLFVHSLDRLARNVDDLRRIVTDLTGRGVAVEFVKERLTFGGRDDAMGKFMLTVLGAFAKGVYKGRARALTTEQAVEVREQALAGMPKAELARAYGISRETLYQYLRR